MSLVCNPFKQSLMGLGAVAGCIQRAEPKQSLTGMGGALGC